MEVINNIFNTEFWYVAPILVAMTTGLTGVINQFFKITDGKWKQLISWLVGTILTVVTYFIGLFTFVDPIWFSILCMSIVVGLVSNGVYDLQVIKNWISTWFMKSK